MRIGLHGRNDVWWPDGDFAMIREAKLDTLKIMSFTNPAVCKRVRDENPGIELIVRLYMEGFGAGGQRPRVTDFVTRVVAEMEALRPYATKFEIHNEPNHVNGVEGWGSSDADARSFAAWYALVLASLRELCPWAKLGFPGLAVPNFLHRDLRWLELCKEQILASDWLGVHCYWQYNNVLSDEWGLRFKMYHALFPGKTLEITEFGDSTPDLKPEVMAQNMEVFYLEAMKYPYLGSASAFIASSPDPSWAPFAWRKESGEVKPVVARVRAMSRSQATFPMLDVVARLPKHKKARYLRRALDTISEIVIHHSAVPASAGAESIARYHVTHYGWPGIGYHFCIAADGTILVTNDLKTISYHAANDNGISVGVCFLGSFMRTTPTDKQLAAGRQLVKFIERTLGRKLDLVAHRNVPSCDTACPGATWESWVASLKDD